MNKPLIGDMVHYTNHGGEDGASPDLKSQVLLNPHPLEAPLPRLPDRPQVLPAMIVGVGNQDLGEVTLRVAYELKDVLVRNCLPSDAQAGSHEAKGKWTPRDRELFNWDAAAHRVDQMAVEQRDVDVRNEEKEFKDLPPQGLKPGEPDPKQEKHKGHPHPPMQGPRR